MYWDRLKKQMGLKKAIDIDYVTTHTDFVIIRPLSVINVEQNSNQFSRVEAE
jgi:hypothetical protein